MTPADRVLSYISTHCRGHCNGKTRAVIAAECGVRDVRKLKLIIAELREQGHFIGAVPWVGVFLCVDQLDFEMAANFHGSLRKDASETERFFREGMRKRFPGGQMMLELEGVA